MRCICSRAVCRGSGFSEWVRFAATPGRSALAHFEPGVSRSHCGEARSPASRLGFCRAGVGLLFWAFAASRIPLRRQVIVAFGFVGAVVALFARWRWHLHQAADVGADLVGKVEAASPRMIPQARVIAVWFGDNAAMRRPRAICSITAARTSGAMSLGAARSVSESRVLFPLVARAFGCLPTTDIRRAHKETRRCRPSTAAIRHDQRLLLAGFYLAVSFLLQGNQSCSSA